DEPVLLEGAHLLGAEPQRVGVSARPNGREEPGERRRMCPGRRRSHDEESILRDTRRFRELEDGAGGWPIRKTSDGLRSLCRERARVRTVADSASIARARSRASYGHGTNEGVRRSRG